MDEQQKSFREVFSHLHVVLPVIHVTSMAQALENVQIARDAGADGAFLINHAISSTELLETFVAVRARFPEWWIGINCLDLAPAEVFKRISGSVNGVWSDNAMIDEACEDQPLARKVLEVRNQQEWPGLYFGGVAFKYQRCVEDIASAARNATHYMDVVTTSGPGTGRSADVDKIRVMKEAFGDFPLAIASGITSENVIDYMPYADCFLVATGISKTFDELDPLKTRRLVEVVRNPEHAAQSRRIFCWGPEKQRAAIKTMQIGDCQMKQVAAPAFMGCEEIVFPMCLRARPATSDGDTDPLEKDFVLADLNRTTTGGLQGAVFGRPHSITEEGILFHGEEWNYKHHGPHDKLGEAIKRMKETLRGFASTFGFFWEQSTHPLAHGYLTRCRFVSPEIVQEYYGVQPGLLQQQHTAEEVAEAFVYKNGFWNGFPWHSVEDLERIIYGPSGHIGYDCGDPENHFIGFGFWKEEEGVCRLWSRITYCPK